MQYQICECGEQIPRNELGKDLLSHWHRQHQTCLYSYIGCVSYSVFQNTLFEVNQYNSSLTQIEKTNIFHDIF